MRSGYLSPGSFSSRYSAVQDFQIWLTVPYPFPTGPGVVTGLQHSLMVPDNPTHTLVISPFINKPRYSNLSVPSFVCLTPTNRCSVYSSMIFSEPYTLAMLGYLFFCQT